jgi:hypothetical protein
MYAHRGGEDGEAVLEVVHPDADDLEDGRDRLTDVRSGAVAAEQLERDLAEPPTGAEAEAEIRRTSPRA